LLRNFFQIPWQKKIVAIQPKASALLRTVPPAVLAEISRRLVNRGVVVLMLGGKGDFPPECKIDGVFDLCGMCPSMYLSVAVLAHCDLLIAPDSSLTHFAAAIEKPTIALYGPFPGEVRTKYYPHCTTIEPPATACPDMPCMIHSETPCPQAQKCGQEYSPCLAKIDAEKIFDLAITRLQEESR